MCTAPRAASCPTRCWRPARRSHCAIPGASRICARARRQRWTSSRNSKKCGDRRRHRLLLPAARTAAAAATTTASARGFGSRRPFLGLVDAQRASTHLEAVRLLYRVLRVAGSHVHERKSARPSGFAIVDELDRLDFAVAFEQRTNFVFRRGKWQVANVDRRHSTNLTNSVSTLRRRGAHHCTGSLHPRKMLRQGNIVGKPILFDLEIGIAVEFLLVETLHGLRFAQAHPAFLDRPFAVAGDAGIQLVGVVLHVLEHLVGRVAFDYLLDPPTPALL